MSRLLTVALLLATCVINAQSCNLKITAFRAYENNFAVIEISYEESPEIVGINFSLDEPTLNERSIQKVDKTSGTSRHGISFQPHRLRVGDTVYYKLFIENGGKMTCQTDLSNFQIQELRIVKPT
ncbi:hypothetical protein RN001_014475 [Aquatica leii]|uniref:Uncharacterized protein n=1 Tax=Aquatica leii TaxID=1421715 RepID=A0AAN7S680_9COLE|nr:hypothetical protein RN001_014475 [Aquatica leii]